MIRSHFLIAGRCLVAGLAVITRPAVSLMASPASAQTVTVNNSLNVARTDSLVEVRTARHAQAWSVKIGDQVFPAQYLNGKVRFVVSLAAHQSLPVTLVPQAAPDSPRRVLVTLNIQDGGKLEGDAASGGAIKGGTFHLRDHYTVPKDHFIHDGLIGFEGIGWESDRVAYRLYLDTRAVPDLFGKYGTDMIFPNVGHGFDDYQYPRVWGGDIYKVGNALGMGGLGLLRDGKATQVGPSTVTGRVVANGPVTAIAGVDADAVGGGRAFIHTTYALSAGDTVTHVDVAASSIKLPLVAGLTVHPGDTVIPSSPPSGAWTYIAVWGPQEHDKDEIGTALFYRSASVAGEAGNDGQTVYVRFASRTQAHYAFAGRWVYENKDLAGNHAIKDINAFKAWLDAKTQELDHPVETTR